MDYKLIIQYIVFYQDFLIFLLVILMIIFLARYARHHVKSKYYKPYYNETDIEDSQFYIEYYKKIQLVNIYSTIAYILVILWFSQSQKYNIFTSLAIGVGAVMLILQPYLKSILVYLTILTDFRIGDTVRIQDYQGEIIAIRPLYTKISGKNDSAEHNGKLYQIPNNILMENAITKIDLYIYSIEKEVLTICYRAEDFVDKFDIFVYSFEQFLDEIFEVHTLATASHFKTYIGYKYKINYSYEKNGDIIIYLGYLDNIADIPHINKRIISRIESQKKLPKEELSKE